ncbi:MAG TPA: PAS domain-containing protein [Ferrovibrio sp.]|uniref:PAS domain-containing protein n=1 Tax=Ferrovibrio sp. TaxID=1917215 RepID=UPI002ED28CB8
MRELAEYWFARRDGTGVPPREAINPLDFPRLLPNVGLLDRVLAEDGSGSERFRIRLAGEEITYAVGRPLAGYFLDEVQPDRYREFAALLIRLAVERRRPVYSSSLFHDAGNIVNGLTHTLLMPLHRQESVEPDMLFVCQFFQHREDGGLRSGDWLSVTPEIRLIVSP